MNEEQEAIKALDCLYIALPKEIADDVNKKLRDYINSLRAQLSAAQAKADFLTEYAAELQEYFDSKYANIGDELRALITPRRIIKDYQTVIYYRPHPQSWWDDTMEPEAEEKYNNALKAVSEFEKEALRKDGE